MVNWYSKTYIDFINHSKTKIFRSLKSKKSSVVNWACSIFLGVAVLLYPRFSPKLGTENHWSMSQGKLIDQFIGHVFIFHIIRPLSFLLLHRLVYCFPAIRISPFGYPQIIRPGVRKSHEIIIKNGTSLGWPWLTPQIHWAIGIGRPCSSRFLDFQ